ncbi:hypothetical protein MQE23_08710 [Streptomyces sp. HP-A2021]|uniref:hypothetical protein n=1 Tax=Streptomyces sp. HP-A2021 TaxID=2927875 RepID=UPI001FAF6245|nr:hypothetical protein [Streptomyces sp. HP-A2021]UOB09132.1 hypothetical protein MQE23_08710 [Streptomyces sp. HP-A2021]
MSDHITVGAASLFGALVFATGVVRWAVAPTRARNVAARQPSTWPVPGAVIVQAFAWCPVCRMDLPGTVHGTTYRCPYGHLTEGGE